MVGAELPGPDPELQQFVNRNLSTTTRNRCGGRQYYWALTICAHCRRWSPTTTVFACCQMGAHHREVVLVDVKGARESVGILCPASEQLVHKTTRVLPPTVKGLELGTIIDLDPDSTVKVDDRVTFVVSCEECAGLSLGHCIDKGHVQLERPASKLPEKTARRPRHIPRTPTPTKRKAGPTPSKASGSAKKTAAAAAAAAAAAGAGGGGGVRNEEGAGTKNCLKGVRKGSAISGGKQAGGGENKRNGGGAAAAAAAAGAASSSGEKGKTGAGEGGEKTSKGRTRAAASAAVGSPVCGVKTGVVGGRTKKSVSAEGGAQAQVGGEKRVQERAKPPPPPPPRGAATAAAVRAAADTISEPRGVSYGGGHNGGGGNDGSGHRSSGAVISEGACVAAGVAKGGKEGVRSMKRSRAPDNERGGGGGGGGGVDGVRSPSRRASGSGEEDAAAADPRGVPPKRAKVFDAGVASAGAASAPTVVETVAKSISRVDDVDAPVLVSATDSERGTNASNAHEGERKTDGQDSPPPAAPAPSARNNGSGGAPPPEKVVPPSSPSTSPPLLSAVSGKKVPPAKPATATATAALTAKALGEDAAVPGFESDAAQRTCLPSSASSSCSLSSASSVAVADAGAGGGRSRSSGNGDRPEYADEPGAVGADVEKGAGAVARGSVKECAAGAEAGGGKGKGEEEMERTAVADAFGEKAKKEPPEQQAGAAEPSVAITAAVASPLSDGGTPPPVCAGAAPPAPPACESTQPASPPALSTMAIVSSVAATANDQCTEKKVWLATFLECQRRELERTKESCRNELEALKSKLREKMKDAEDKQTRAREAFCGRLYGIDAAAAVAATAATTAGAGAS